MKKITVLGAGAWGLTLAELLASKNHDVCVWDVDGDALDLLRRERTRGRPPGLVLPPSVQFDGDFASAYAPSQVIVSVVPSHAVRAVCREIAAAGGLGERLFVSCSKGVEEETLKLPSQVFEEVLGSGTAGQFAALSGPSHAEEVCRRIPTVVVCSSSSQPTAGAVRDMFMIPEFRIYTQTDTLGVELGGALKNVIAVAAGITDGMGYGDNTKAALITRGLAEISRAACSLGAQPATLSGLAGLGDLVVTAMSRHSRNRAFGELVGQGVGVREALARVGQVVEGYRNARSAHGLARKIGVEMPITGAVYAVLHEGLGVRKAIELLLQREPKPENY